MDIYGIVIKGFEDPIFGFEDPIFGFEDPIFGYKDGELSKTLLNMVNQKVSANAKRDNDVLHLEISKSDRPVRLVPEDKDKAEAFYAFFDKGIKCIVTVKKPSPDLVAPRRDAIALITLSPK